MPRIKPEPVGIPRAAAERYERELRRSLLTPTIQRMRFDLGEMVKAGALTPDMARQRISEAIAVMERTARDVAQEIANGHVVRTARWHRRRFIKTMRQAGLDITPFLSEDAVRQLLADRIGDNVRLIRTIPRRMHAGLLRRLDRLAVSDRFNPDKLRRMLNEEFGSTGWNLRRLTRDQTTKQIGQLTQIRHMQSGFRRYYWIHSGKIQNARPEHVALDGSIQSWSNPPDGHPGEKILCMCQASPYVETQDIQRAQSKDDIVALSRGHGISRPKPGTIAARVWQIADRMKGQSRKDILAATSAEGIKPTSAAFYYQKWKKFTEAGKAAKRINKTGTKAVAEQSIEEWYKSLTVEELDKLVGSLTRARIFRNRLAFDDLLATEKARLRKGFQNLTDSDLLEAQAVHDEVLALFSQRRRELVARRNHTIEILDKLDADGRANDRLRRISIGSRARRKHVLEWEENGFRKRHTVDADTYFRSVVAHEMGHHVEWALKLADESVAMLTRLETRFSRRQLQWLSSKRDYAFKRYYDGSGTLTSTELLSSALQHYVTNRAWMLQRPGGRELVDWLEKHVFKKGRRAAPKPRRAGYRSGSDGYVETYKDAGKRWNRLDNSWMTQRERDALARFIAGSVGEAYSAADVAIVERLFLRAGAKLPPNTILYRGIPSRYVKDVARGDVITNPSFAFTSTSADHASAFGSVLRITNARKGLKSTGGTAWEEREVLLQKGLRFRVTGIRTLRRNSKRDAEDNEWWQMIFAENERKEIRVIDIEIINQ